MSISSSKGLIAKNSFYNIIGYGLPLLFALILIPPLINGLGIERFGILSLIWIIIGYSSFFDFGIGKSLTKIVAEKIGLNSTETIPGIFWNSMIIMFWMSIAISGLMILIVPYLTNDVFNISEELRSEATSAFYLMAISIPIVVTTTGVRGILEAYQKFGIINLVRTFLGIFTFLGPLLIILISNSLFWVVFILLLIRIIVWLIYLVEIFKINPYIKTGFEIKLDYTVIKSILKLSIWITIANIVGPLMIYSDRFLIGSFASAIAVTYYSTPYEVITKLLLLPTALTAVLFPIFSSNYLKDINFTKNIFTKGVKIIFLILFPIVMIIMNFSFEALKFWLGIEFAKNSFFVLQVLSFGVLLNSLTFIPFNYMQGVGKPMIPALINLIELPFYIIAIWIAVVNWGINGVAVVWTTRIIIDTGAMFYVSNKIFGLKFDNKFIYFFYSSIFICMLFIFLTDSVLIRSILVAIFLLAFIIISWNLIISTEEKKFIKYKLLNRNYPE